MWASEFKMPALYLATRATFSAIYRFRRWGLLWWLLCFNFGAVAWKCDKCKSGERGVLCLGERGCAPRGHGVGVCRRIAAEKQPSPLQNKPLPRPQEFGVWGRVPPGHELLQSCWYPSPWDRGLFPASISTGLFLFVFVLITISFSRLSSLHPLCGKRRLAHVAFFLMKKKICGFFFSFSRCVKQSMVSTCCLEKWIFPFFPNSLKRKGLFCDIALWRLTFVSCEFSSGSG